MIDRLELARVVYEYSTRFVHLLGIVGIEYICSVLHVQHSTGYSGSGSVICSDLISPRDDHILTGSRRRNSICRVVTRGVGG